ncbi:MAG: hypothetical protein FWF57_05245 [Defluviitaleaceae bacterium]|nr:hypothetical protein [Defluviitaleaceae bacterium]
MDMQINIGNRINFFVKPYNKTALPLIAHIVAGVFGYAIFFGVLWLFYRSIILSTIIAIFMVPMAIVLNINMAKAKRLKKLMGQFKSLLESLVVSLQAGSTDLDAFINALEDMRLMYSEQSDIAKEVNLIIVKFSNRETIGEALEDFAKRSGLQDIILFANVYKLIEGKGDKTSEIVIRTQRILSDKIEIETEIKTLASGALMEINIIALVPILIVAVMGFMGGDLMSSLFTPVGNVVATIAIGIFIGAYALGRKLANIKV